MKYIVWIISVSLVFASCKGKENPGNDGSSKPLTHKPVPVGPETSMAHNPIVGNWKMLKITDENKDVTTEHNPENDRWIQFIANQKFVSDGTPYGRNTGKWYWMPKKNLLFLDSDVGEEDDSYWTVSFEKDRMIWQGAKTDWAKRFKIIHTKGQWIEDLDGSPETTK